MASVTLIPSSLDISFLKEAPPKKAHNSFPLPSALLSLSSLCVSFIVETPIVAATDDNASEISPELITDTAEIANEVIKLIPLCSFSYIGLPPSTKGYESSEIKSISMSPSALCASFIIPESSMIPLILKFDVDRDVRNIWRYENYGTADLLTIPGTTITDLSEKQSKTGSAFYQPTRSKCFDIPVTKEIWIKCDVYTTASYKGTDRIRIYSEDAHGINGWTTQTTAPTAKYQIWHNGTSQTLDSTLSTDKRRCIRVHMKSGVSDGIIEVDVGSSFYTYSGNVNAGDDFDNVYIQMDGSNILVSNLIISNGEVGLDEDVVFGFLRSYTFDVIREVEFKEEIYVTVNCDVVREVEIKEEAAALNLCIVDIYDISLRTGEVYICNTDRDITFEGKKYISIPIQREEISRTVDDIDNDVKISMSDATTDQLQFIIAGFDFRGCKVRIRQIIYPDSTYDDSIQRDCFYGYIDNPAYENGEFTCTLRARIPKVTVPRRTYQSSCNCKFGDHICGMDTCQTTGVISAVDADNRIIIEQREDDEFWNNGLITIEGETRMIRVSKENVITTFYPFFATIKQGMTYAIQRGCDKTYTRCKKYGNLGHFAGFPSIPFETIYR